MISICNTNAIKIKQCVGPSIYKSVSFGWKSLPSTHKPQRRHTDADGRREDEAQGDKAGHQSRTGSEDIIDEQHVSDVFAEDCFEGVAYILLLVLYTQSCLRHCVLLSMQYVGLHRDAKLFCDASGNDFRLIVSSGPSSSPMQRNGNYCIHIAEP